MTSTIARNQRSHSGAGWKLLAVGLGMVALSGTAAARDNVSFSITFGVPAPVYAQVHAYPYAQPVYYAQPRVVYAQPHVIHAPPRVVYYAAPHYAPRHRDHRGHGGRNHQHGWR